MIEITNEILQNLPSPYYRVATRAIVLDDTQRLLVMENHDGHYELPGGGLEFDESFEDCLRREIREELGTELSWCDDHVSFIYRGRGSRGIMYLRLGVRAGLASYNFKPVDMKRAFWASREEFLALDLKPAAEAGLQGFADKIWQ